MTLPDELQRAVPRPVTLTAVGRRTLVGRCVKFVFIVALLLWTTGTPTAHPPVSSAAAGTAAYSSWWPATGRGWGAAEAFLIGAVVGIVSYRRQWRLLATGRATIATVIADVTPKWYVFRGGRRHQTMRRLQCEFRLLNGRVLRTTVTTRDPAPKADSEIVLLYDRDEPERTLYYPARMLTIRGK